MTQEDYLKLLIKVLCFWDEIGDTPLPIQVKLLRAIQEKTFKPVGGVKDINVDVRVIAASNRDLEERVKNGSFQRRSFLSS